MIGHQLQATSHRLDIFFGFARNILLGGVQG